MSSVVDPSTVTTVPSRSVPPGSTDSNAGCVGTAFESSRVACMPRMRACSSSTRDGDSVGSEGSGHGHCSSFEHMFEYGKSVVPTVHIMRELPTDARTTRDQHRMSAATDTTDGGTAPRHGDGRARAR